MGPVGDAALREAFFDGYREAQHKVHTHEYIGSTVQEILAFMNADLKLHKQLAICGCGDACHPQDLALPPTAEFVCDNCKGVPDAWLR